MGSHRVGHDCSDLAVAAVISLTIMISASIMLSQMVGFPYFSWLNNIPLCVRACVFVCVCVCVHVLVCIKT